MRAAFCTQRSDRECQFRRTHPPADQIGIEQQRLHKTVPGTTGDPFGVRFGNAADRIGTDIDDHGLRKTFYQKDRGATENVLQNRIYRGSQ